MKKLLYTLAGLSALALFASCNKEAERAASPEGEVVTATFTVAAPEGVATKAISDGTTATNLIVAVYDEQKNYLQALSESAVKSRDGLTWTVSMKVIKDMTYQFVFIAKSASDNGFSTFTPATGKLAIDYSQLSANNDNADFFFVQDKFKVENSFSKTEEMHRPLAQVNFGASDLAEAGYSINTATMATGITLTGIYSEMDVLTEAATGDAGDVTFEKAARVSETPQFVTNYDRIAMVYALVAKNQANVSATLNVTAKGAQNDVDHTITRVITNVPLKRNYRTNILGNIFTNDFNFTVNTVPGFYTPEYNEQAGITIAKANTAFANGQTSVTIDTNPETAADGITTITLPATTDDVRVRLNITTDKTITIQYASGAKPANVEIYALNVNEVIASLSASHVTITSGSHITTGTFATSPTTLVLEKTAVVTNLMIKAGNVKLNVGSVVSSITRTTDNADEKTIVEVESGLPSYPSLVGSDIEFKKDITGVTIEKTETKATYSVSAEAFPETALEAIVADNNSEPKKDVVVEVASGSEIQWECKYDDERTMVASDNTVTETIVIEGTGMSSAFRATDNGVRGVQSGDGTILFKNITIYDDTRYDAENGNNAWEFAYLEWKGKIRCENVVFADAIQIEGNDSEVEFINCKFIADGNAKRAENKQTDEYGVWISGCKSAVFENCDFTGFRGPKAHEAYGTEITEISFNNCTFHDLTKKPGIALGDINAATKVSITNCTFTNCQPGDQELYAYETDTNVDTFNFTFENNEVLLTEGVSILGASSYGLTSPVGLAYATENLFTKGGTFTLVNDIDMTGVEYKAVNVGKGITIDGNGKTISNIDITAANGIQAGLIGRVAAPVTIKNLTIDGGTVTGTNNMDGEYSAGALIGWLEVHSDWTVDVLNCTVKNLTVNSCKYVGGLIGYESANKCLKIDGCSVIDCVLNSEYTEDGGTIFKGHCGGVVGYLEQGNIDNTLVSGVTLSGKGERFGALAGSAQASAVLGGGNKVSNVTIKGVKVTDKNALTGDVDNRTDKSHDDNIIIE